jgi:hypothetical protein
MVSYAVRFPELAAKSKQVGGDVDIDPAVRAFCSLFPVYQPSFDYIDG